jgi:hypothetical protein
LRGKTRSSPSEAARIKTTSDLTGSRPFWWCKENQFTILLLYVDDILTIFNHKQKMQEVERAREFEIKCLGSTKKFLGLEIERDIENKILHLHQRKFMEMITKFGMSGCNERITPIDTPMITKGGGKKGEKNKITLNNRIWDKLKSAALENILNGCNLAQMYIPLIKVDEKAFYNKYLIGRAREETLIYGNLHPQQWVSFFMMNVYPL